MDIFDQAQELERLDREAALQRARSRVQTGGPEWIDGVACCRSWQRSARRSRLVHEPLPALGGQAAFVVSSSAVVWFAYTQER